MRRFDAPRSGLRDRREVVAGLGARHPITYTKDVRNFFWQLDERWAKILPEREPWERQLTGQQERRFRVYDDPEKLGVTVLERRLVTRYAERRRNTVNKSDLGRTQVDIARGLGRLGTLYEGFDMTFSTAIRVGDASSGKPKANAKGAKFAIVANRPEFATVAPDEDHCGDTFSDLLEDGEELERDAYGLLVAEHDIVVDGVTGVFHDFRYPYDEYVPKMTVGRVFRDASQSQIEDCEAQLLELLAQQPLTVELEPLVVFTSDFS